MSNFTQYYTLRIMSGKENAIKEHLPYLEGFENQVEEIFIPHEKTLQTRNNKKIVVNKNLMPGYIFIKFKKTPDPDFIKLVEKSNFVSSFLRENGRTGNPVPLRESELKNILGNIEMSQERVKDYSVGDKVKIIDGAFSSFSGVISDVHHDKKKMTVNVKVFGRSTPMELTYTQVEKVF